MLPAFWFLITPAIYGKVPDRYVIGNSKICRFVDNILVKLLHILPWGPGRFNVVEIFKLQRNFSILFFRKIGIIFIVYFWEKLYLQ